MRSRESATFTRAATGAGIGALIGAFKPAFVGFFRDSAQRSEVPLVVPSAGILATKKTTQQADEPVNVSDWRSVL